MDLKLTGASPIQCFSRLSAAITLLRTRERARNTFVLAPLVFADAFTQRALVDQALLAFASFCGAASAVERCMEQVRV